MMFILLKVERKYEGRRRPGQKFWDGSVDKEVLTGKIKVELHKRATEKGVNRSWNLVSFKTDTSSLFLILPSGA